MLHKRRLKDPDVAQRENAAFIEEIKGDKMLYTTPYGSNDDWYWLYATVQVRPCVRYRFYSCLSTSPLRQYCTPPATLFHTRLLPFHGQVKQAQVFTILSK